MLALLLAAAVTTWQWQPVRTPVLHQGFVRLCNGDERVLEHRVNGHLLWELHILAERFGLYAFRVADGDHTHDDKLNLLTAPDVDAMWTFRGARQWTVETLRLWVSVVRAGETAEGCESFYIRVETK